MFLMPATMWLVELERSRPDIAAACAQAMAGAQRADSFVRPDGAHWATCPRESIDYAVMEGVGGASPGQPSYAVIPLDVGWSDVGAWSAVWAMGSQGRRRQQHAGRRLPAGHQELTPGVSRRRLLAGIGLEDIVVVETADAVLVARRDRVQEVRQVVESLGQAGRTEQESYPHVHRPWGTFTVVDSGPGFQVKRLMVHPARQSRCNGTSTAPSAGSS